MPHGAAGKAGSVGVVQRQGGQSPATRTSAPPRNRRRFFSRAIALLFAIFGTAIATGLTCSQMRPAWYRATAIDYARLDADKAALIALYDSISVALNRRESATIELDEGLLNRAIAAHDEMWPELRDLFNGMRDLRVRLGDGDVIELAAVPTSLDWPLVAVVGARLSVGTRIRADLTHAGIGRLAAPGSLLWPRIRSALQLEQFNRVALDDRGLAIFNEWVWENGRVLFRVSEVEVRSGVLKLVLTPIPNSPA